MNQKRLTYSVLTKLVQNKISVKLAKILLYVLSKFVELLLIEINWKYDLKIIISHVFQVVKNKYKIVSYTTN